MELTKISLENLKRKLPNLPITDYSVFMAGGVVRDSLLGIDYDDIDIFGLSRTKLDEFMKYLLDNKYKQVYDSDFLKSFRKEKTKIQIIYRDYQSIYDILDNFDYTICQFLYTGTELYCNPEGLLHINQKRLVVHKLSFQYVVNSMERMQKYIKKGYTICSGGIKQIVETIRLASEKDIEDSFEFYLGDTTKRRIIRFD